MQDCSKDRETWFTRAASVALLLARTSYAQPHLSSLTSSASNEHG